MKNNIAWSNGRFLDISEVNISPLDWGFQFGDGLFETIRFQKGKILSLKDHVNRLTNSLSVLGYDISNSYVSSVLDTRKLKSIIFKIADLNGLMSRVCRIKIMISRGIQPDFGLPKPNSPTVIVMMFPYTEPSSEEYNRGWKVTILKEAFTPFMSIHKSTSYLFYLWVKQQAVNSNAQEAIIPDKNGMVAEGSMTSLLLYKNGVWYQPKSEWKLPGITVKSATTTLEQLGYRVKSKEIPINNIKEFGTIWLLNSMLGVMPVKSIDEFILPDKMSDLATKVRNILFKIGDSH